jgi:hypothetical protein
MLRVRLEVKFMTRLTRTLGVLPGTAALALMFTTGFSLAASTQSLPPPSASAPFAIWQTWAKSEQVSMQSTNWAQVLPSEIGSGQQLVNWGIVSTTSTGAGIIPAGITTDNLWYLTKRTPSTSGS